jgi:hypothetical protein
MAEFKDGEMPGELHYFNTDSYGKGWIAIIEPDNLEEDFKDLIHGEENVQAFLEADYKKYEDEGLFADDEEEK